MRECSTRLWERIQRGNKPIGKTPPKTFGRYRYEWEVVRGKRNKLNKIDIWDEIDNRGVELFEHVRSQFNYTEQELREKPIHLFLDIVERANKKVESQNKLAKKAK